MPGAKLEQLVADNGTAEGAANTRRQFPEVDILINHLGIYEAVGCFDETDDAWQRLVAVNVLSGVRLSRHYLKTMREQQTGRVLFLASDAAIMPAPEMAHDSATKTMVFSVSRRLAERTTGTAVTVDAIVAGSTKTAGVATFIQDLCPGLSLEEAEKRFMGERGHRSSVLLQRLIDPKEIADCVTYVSSPLASAINGAVLRVNGGLVRSVL